MKVIWNLRRLCNGKLLLSGCVKVSENYVAGYRKVTRNSERRAAMRSIREVLKHQVGAV